MAKFEYAIKFELPASFSVVKFSQLKMAVHIAVFNTA